MPSENLVELGIARVSSRRHARRARRECVAAALALVLQVRDLDACRGRLRDGR